MLLALLPLRAATLAFTGWLAAVPGPTGDAARAEIRAASEPAVTIQLYDENHREYATIRVGRDGSLDPASADAVERLLRCKRTERRHAISPTTLAMFANVADRWSGHTIDIISGYRTARRESRGSLHRAARAIDFRVRGVPLKVVRDYMWKNFRGVGVGYYPEGKFLHLDSRKPGMRDTAWTFRRGKNRYRPSWAERIRPAVEEPPREQRRNKPHKQRPHRRHRGAGV